MWNGKLKAITFSFDDGVSQDVRAIEILDKYGLKATFNLNSSLFGLDAKLDRNNHIVDHNKIPISKVREVYKNHEVASHTLVHPLLTKQNDESVIYQVSEDVKTLSKIFDREIVGFAYPGGGVNFDDRVAKLIKENTSLKYARTTVSSYNYDIQDDLFTFKPTVYFIEDNLFDICRDFINLKTDKPQLLYIWGHTYEMDAEYISWEKFEELCKMISNKEDIFYGTNAEVLL